MAFSQNSDQNHVPDLVRPVPVPGTVFTAVALIDKGYVVPIIVKQHNKFN